MESKQTIRWTTAVVENFFFCGFLLGWHMLQNVFADEGFFCSDGGASTAANMTTNVTASMNETIDTCDRTYQQTQMMGTFSISVAVMPVSAFFFGAVTGKLGTVNVRIILHVLWLIGFALFFVAKPGSSDYLVTVGCCFLTISGLNMAITNYPSSHLSGDKHGTVLSVMCGAFDESAAMGNSSR